MATTKYIWDPENDSVAMETDENDVTKAVYTRTPDGELISQYRDGKTTYYHYDGQGNTVALTDENETVTDTYEYTAFGEEVSHTGTTTNPYRFVGAYGYQYDKETGEYYILERILDPENGRWTSQDPIGFEDGMNVYVYVGNDPVNGIDPTGQIKVTPKGMKLDGIKCGQGAYISWCVSP